MTTNFQLAKRIADHVQLLSITLSRASVEAKFDPTKLPEGMGLSQSYRAVYLEPESSMGSDKFSVLVDFKFFATKVEASDAEREEEVAEGDLATLDAAFQLVYLIPSELDAEPRCFKHFAEVNGPYNAWPYWRELVQSVTGRIGLAGVTVPVFHPRSEEVDDEEMGEKG